MLSSCLNVCCVFVSLFFFSFSFSFSITWTFWTKRPLFILFCQQPKRRGECPPNAIIQSTPPQRCTCFPLSKTDIFQFLAVYRTFSRLFLCLLLFPRFLFLFFFFNFLFLRHAKPLLGTNVPTRRMLVSLQSIWQSTRSRASRKDHLDWMQIRIDERKLAGLKKRNAPGTWDKAIAWKRGNNLGISLRRTVSRVVIRRPGICHWEKISLTGIMEINFHAK